MSEPLDLCSVFEEYNDDFLEFSRIAEPRHKRPDMAAFLLLDELAPGKGDMVTGATHDEIWLSVDVDALAMAATREDILYLVRCGVRYSEEFDSLAMFV